MLCPCRDKNPHVVCHGACMTNSVRCMGVSVYVSPSVVFCHAHPNALDATGALKFGAPLQSYWATSSRCTTNVFLSARANALPLLRSWGAFLFSAVTWMQLAVLSGYPLRAVRASMQAVVHRLLAKTAKTAWDVPCTLQRVLFILPWLPQSVADTAQDLIMWLWRSAWHGTWYASWHLHHTGACSDFCVDWSFDLPIILSMSRLLSGQPRVDWGVHRGRG